MIRKHKTKIIAALIIVISFTLVFFQREEKSEYKIQHEEEIEVVMQKEDVPEETPATSSDFEEIKIQQPVKKEKEITKEEIKESEKEIITEEIKETEDETENDTIKELNCTLSVKCDTIINNKEQLKPEKLEIVPQDGVIFAEQIVVFYEGESVFNLLVREMKKNKIHLEFVNTPLYKTAYIERIANLYEKDCGDNSGWIYRVNGISPGYGCSNYKLKEGDKVEWIYSCDLGRDIGG